MTVHTRREDPAVAARVPFGRGVVVHHASAGPPQPLPKDELLPYMGELAGELADVWARERPDVVHAHFWMSGIAALAAARPLGIPVVQTFHALGRVKRRYQGAEDSSPRQRLALERRDALGADLIIATCSDEAAELTSTPRRWLQR